MMAWGCAAGRVQSVALRLVVEREADIERFMAQEYWSVAALLRSASGLEFEARLVQVLPARCKPFADDVDRRCLPCFCTPVNPAAESGRPLARM